MSGQEPKLYSSLAEWFHLLTRPEDYAEEAEFYRRAILSASTGTCRTLLELGCGGGNNASWMKEYFQLTLTDISPDMLSVSRSINPECEHLLGDMRTLRLDRVFDAVFIHDAVSLSHYTRRTPPGDRDSLESLSARRRRSLHS